MCREDELVAFEKSSGRVHEDAVRDAVRQVGHPDSDVLGLCRPLDGHVEHDAERLQRELAETNNKLKNLLAVHVKTVADFVGLNNLVYLPTLELCKLSFLLQDSKALMWTYPQMEPIVTVQSRVNTLL